MARREPHYRVSANPIVKTFPSLRLSFPPSPTASDATVLNQLGTPAMERGCRLLRINERARTELCGNVQRDE